MEAKALSPRDLFDGKIRFDIPPFQRPYVWNEEDQWEPLWSDIVRIVDHRLEGEPNRRHFLGAIVVKDQGHGAGDVALTSVIDGQQRLTTLQLLLDAAERVVAELGDEDDAESLAELVRNASKRFEGTPSRFKLWPSRADREAFEQAMDDTLTPTAELAERRIVQAHQFFHGTIRNWATGEDPDAAVGDPVARLASLAKALQHDLQLVAIDLAQDDDDQLIFETLNDRGTPLLAADLIKNMVFQRCEQLIGVDIDHWNEKYWKDFDDDWWRAQITQGRLHRSRIDLFLQYWLTMRTREEVPSEEIFKAFRTHADLSLEDSLTAETFLAELRRDADTFRQFTDLDPASPEGRFYGRVVETLELGAFMPLLLWMTSENHTVPAEEAASALAAVESWTVRRTLLRRTMKDVNRFVIAMLRELDAPGDRTVSDSLVQFLSDQTADARTWPTDEEVLEELPEVKVYGNIKQARLRAVLSAVELSQRTDESENVTLPDRLELEHVMPRGWRTHWGAGVVHDPVAAARRDRLVHTIGNLTLVTKKLNGRLSNRPWTDSEASGLKDGGEPGLGKRSLLGRFSLLVLNKHIVDDHPLAWTEDDIRIRSDRIASRVIDIWPRP